jgi:hypothetical protein
MELPEIREALGPGHPQFRAKQIYTALYRQKVADLVQVTTLPAALRTELAGPQRVGLPEIARVYDSTDGTRRYLLRLEDGRTVETVLMPEDERSTICISSQVGCPVDCKFCMTALMGLERNLTAGEIVGQVLLVARENGLLKERERLNIVMMGQGEPLLNLANVVKASRLLTDPEGVGIPVRRITVSTAGITGTSQAIDFVERFHRRDAAGVDAHHPQVSSERSAGGVQGVSAAALGEADVRVRAAEGRKRQRCRCAPRGETAGQPECEGEPDRAESRPRHSVRDSRSRAGGELSVHHPAGDGVFHPQAARSGYLRRLRAVEAQRNREFMISAA